MAILSCSVGRTHFARNKNREHTHTHKGYYYIAHLRLWICASNILLFHRKYYMNIMHVCHGPQEATEKVRPGPILDGKLSMSKSIHTVCTKLYNI